MSLLLIKPKLLGFRNRISRSENSRQNITRDLIIVALAASIIASIYRGALWMLTLINSAPGLGTLPPFMPLNGVLFMLMVMLFLSNTLIAIGSIYFGQNNDLLLASPFGRIKLFFARVIDIGFSSSWMPIVFIIPFLLAFKTYYKISNHNFYLSSLAFIPFFIIPISLSMIFALLLGWLLPKVKKGYLKLFFLCLFGLVFFYMGGTLLNAITKKDPSSEIYRILKILSSPLQSYFPSSWVVAVFEECLSPTNLGSKTYFLLLVSVGISTLSLGLLLFDCFYSKLYTKVISNSGNDKKISKDSIFFKLLSKITNPLTYALIKKELRILVRELSSFIEVLLLTSMALLYAYNLRSLSVIELIPDDQKNRWQDILFLLTSLMTIFLITALSNRLVFPSISREGRTIWLLKACPITLNEIISIKHQCWFPIIYLIAFFFINISAFALSANTNFIIVANFLVAVNCYTITKIALGLGSKFAIFDWEHPSQLIASFGSFVFITVSIAYSAMTFIPIWVFSFFPVYKLIFIRFNDNRFFLPCFVVFCILYVIVISKYCVTFFTNQGVERLKNILA